MANIDNSKKSTKSSSKHCHSKVSYTTKYLLNVVFLHKVYLKGILYTAQSFWYKLKILIYCPYTYSNWPKPVALIFFVNIFVSFVKFLNQGKVIHRDEYSFFISHVKSYREWTEKTILALLFRESINQRNRVTANIQLGKCRFKEGLKLV